MPDQCATAVSTRSITTAAALYAPGHLGELTQCVPFELVSPQPARRRRLSLSKADGAVRDGDPRAARGGLPTLRGGRTHLRHVPAARPQPRESPRDPPCPGVPGIPTPQPGQRALPLGPRRHPRPNRRRQLHAPSTSAQGSRLDRLRNPITSGPGPWASAFTTSWRRLIQLPATT